MRDRIESPIRLTKISLCFLVLQVFEYYSAHHLKKAFESVFGRYSVGRLLTQFLL